ncbi:hypothetical protein HHK36_017270 [Tetracentron sinense]|uniref:Uncharacterized protein n=1 Tax=Tetracentron sinense TaxID=13715 RepID=A0A835DBS1_TETSI|nr:hypothetical protein HHK36_017270 [Tetracentron sinense]
MVGVMDNHGYANGSEMTQMDDHEYNSDDKIIPVMLTTFATTITAIASWYRQRYIEKEPSRSQDDDCMRALDGTYILAMVSLLDQARYRNRKHFISQNVLGACSMDMKFNYVLPGWEGSASDSKVHKDAKAYHNKVIENFIELTTIIGHDRANGDGAKTVGETTAQMEFDNDIDQATVEIELNPPNAIGSQQR